MAYILKNDSAKDFFNRIDAELSLVEVKGDSVEHLFVARRLIKELYNSLVSTDIPDETKKEEKNGN